MVRLYDILKSLDLNSKDIRQRFTNKQIKINGRKANNMNLMLNIEDYLFDSGEWLCSHDHDFIRKISGLRFLFDSMGEMFRIKTNLNSKELDYLKGFMFLEVDKKTSYILVKKPKLGNLERYKIEIKQDTNPPK